MAYSISFFSITAPIYTDLRGTQDSAKHHLCVVLLSFVLVLHEARVVLACVAEGTVAEVVAGFV